MVSMEKMCQLLNDRFDNEFVNRGFDITCDGEEFTTRYQDGLWMMYEDDEVNGTHLDLTFEGEVEGVRVSEKEFMEFYDLHTKLGGLI